MINDGMLDLILKALTRTRERERGRKAQFRTEGVRRRERGRDVLFYLLACLVV